MEHLYITLLFFFPFFSLFFQISILFFRSGSSPGHQGVTEEWGIDWNTFLVSSLNFVVAIIDARGSSGQSDELKFEIQKKIGTIDVEDQLSVLL